MSQIAYRYKDALYLNITNVCPTACTFCLRDSFAAIGDADSLWLDREPTSKDVIAAIKKYEPLDTYSEVVFCGFGEPFSSYDVMIDTARWLKEQGVKHLRVNTIGLGDLIVGRPTAPELAGLVDELSVSLNAPDAETFEAICAPEFGIQSYEAILSFVESAKDYVPQISLSVVDFLTAEEIAACKDIASKLGLPLRIRQFS
ncbi:MAG: TatD family nuclease-associated radical SAM protein [Coriobacteriia bacterium]|nr:TatD family nuclease-associated radical SAM protein [Coriobacteriia bacterium]